MLKQVNYDTESGLMILAGEVQTNTEATESEPRDDDGMVEQGTEGNTNGETNGEGGEGNENNGQE